MEERINSNFVDTITTLFPSKKKSVDFVASTLSIGKSSAIRRLNKDVLFSYGEAVILAQELNLSLDSLLSSKNMHIRLAFKELDTDSIDFSKHVLQSHLDLYEKIDDISQTTLSIACNIMPYSSVLRYDYLYKFYIYKKYFQNVTSVSIKTFAESKIPTSHKTLRKRLHLRVNAIHSTTIILTNI